MAGTIVTPKQAHPRLHATPNSVIFIPCLKKLRTVVANSGMRFPIATTIPVMSQLNPYLFDILRSAGKSNLSEISAKSIRMYRANTISKAKNTLLSYNSRNFFSKLSKSPPSSSSTIYLYKLLN